MKIRFHCVKQLTDMHDVNLPLADLITAWPPVCCGVTMEPADPNEWRRISRVLNLVNTQLRAAGLPALADLLLQARPDSAST